MTSPPPPAPGWHPAPDDPSRLRYWDGMEWTNDYADPTTPMHPTKVDDKMLFGAPVWGWVLIVFGVALGLYYAVKG